MPVRRRSGELEQPVGTWPCVSFAANRQVARPAPILRGWTTKPAATTGRQGSQTLVRWGTRSPAAWPRTSGLDPDRCRGRWLEPVVVVAIADRVGAAARRHADRRPVARRPEARRGAAGRRGRPPRPPALGRHQGHDCRASPGRTGPPRPRPDRWFGRPMAARRRSTRPRSERWRARSSSGSGRARSSGDRCGCACGSTSRLRQRRGGGSDGRRWRRPRRQSGPGRHAAGG